jgi:hypothetical protein
LKLLFKNLSLAVLTRSFRQFVYAPSPQVVIHWRFVRLDGIITSHVQCKKAQLLFAFQGRASPAGIKLSPSEPRSLPKVMKTTP